MTQGSERFGLTRRAAVVGGIGGLAAIAVGRAARPVTAAQTEAAGSATLRSGMAGAAARFLESLDGEALARASYAFGDEERQRWHWTTPSNVPRNGLALNEMGEEQRARALALLEASVSPTGYEKALEIMSLQRDLGSDPMLYYVTVFGTPGGDEPWGWRFEGHHLSRHFAVVGDRVVVTPFFLGAWPTETGAGLRAMAREEDAARELVGSLLADGRAAARFQIDSLTEHLTGNRARVEPLDPVGVAAAEFDAAEQALVHEIVDTYLGVLPSVAATAILDRITAAGFEEVRFGWAGSVEPGLPHYYRLQGPTFLLEFDNSRNSGTHIHSVWRDFEEDFGANLA